MALKTDRLIGYGADQQASYYLADKTLRVMFKVFRILMLSAALIVLLMKT
tara:strand:- start:535 stop:684 length:150 start_codon:yes stop_codon:yes gene_type:complete